MPWDKLRADRHSAAVVEYHVALCKQAGFVVYGGSAQDGCYQLTWQGHEFLAAREGR